MSIRQDQAQLIITIDAKESVEYQKAVQRSNELVRNIKKMEVGTDEYNAALREQVEISKRLGDVDYTKLSLKNLQDRRRALQEQIRILPQAQAAELGLERELQRVNTALAQNAQRTRAVSQVIEQNTKSTVNWRNAYAVGVGILTSASVAIGSITAKFEKYSAILKVALGSQQQADAALELIKKTAEETTFSVDELTASYVKFANRGIKLTKDEIISLADLAASQGKSFDQLTEAILDAQTGEFERLKEFGIRASKSGDEANISFKGFNTTAKLTPDAIKSVFIEMGKLNGVAGANAEQMGKLSGRFSNFKDAIESTLVAIGSRFANALGNAIGAVTSLVNKFREFIEIPISEKLQEEQAQLNGLVQAITDTNTSQSRRNELIAELQNKYPFFLENLNAETVSNEQLKQRLAEVNELYIKRIALQAQQERIDKLLKTAADARLTQFDKEKTRRTELNRLVAEFKLPLDLNRLNGLDKQTSAVANELQKLFKLGEESARDGTRAINGNIQAYNAYNRIIGQTLATRGAANVVNKTRDEVAAAQDDLKQLEQDLGSTLSDLNALFTGTSVTNSPVGSTGPSPEALKKAAEAREKAKAEAEKAAKEKYAKQLTERNELNQFIGTVQFDPAFAQKVLDARLAQLEAAAEREQQILQESFLQGKITEEQYNLERLRITQANLATRIELLDSFGQQESDKRRELSIELLQIEKDIIQQRAAEIAELENAALTDVEQKFRDRLISEEEYNLSRLAVQRNFLDEQLRLLEENGLTETEVYRKIQEEKARVQGEYNTQKVDNERRTQQLIEAIQSEGLGIAADLFSASADLLAQDEKQRKKYASAIKAFETSSILINSLAEIAENYRNAARVYKEPITAFAVGTARAVITGIRAAGAIAKVNAQKFYGGGKIKNISGQLITESPNIPTQPGGDNVLIAAKPGEVVLNDRQQAALGGAATFRRIGVPGFNFGGIVPSLPSTTPSNLNARVLSNNPAQQPIVQQDPRVEMLANAIEKFANIMPQALSNIKADVSYFDIKSKESTINEIKDLSRY